jgi:hypothetical protein
MRFPAVGAVYDRPHCVGLHSSKLWAVIDRPYSRSIRTCSQSMFKKSRAVYEAVKKLGTESNFLYKPLHINCVSREIALCPQFLHSFIDRAYSRRCPASPLIYLSAWAGANCCNASFTSSCCSIFRPGNIGSERISAVTASVTGRSPFRKPSCT